MADLIIDDQEVLNKLERLSRGGVLKDAMEEPLTKACLKVENDAKRNCPVQTGTLRNSITHTIEDEGETLAGYVGSNLEYAPYVHQGTGIYALEGNGRKEVPWFYFSEKDGKLHSTRGSKPNPFLQDAIDANRQTIIEYFDSFLSELERRLK